MLRTVDLIEREAIEHSHMKGLTQADMVNKLKVLHFILLRFLSIITRFVYYNWVFTNKVLFINVVFKL